MAIELDKPIKDAVKIVQRRHRVDWLDDDDLAQIAQLALLESRAKGRADPVGTDRRHQNNIDRQRCVYAMLDAMRATFKQLPPVVFSGDDDDNNLLENVSEPHEKRTDDVARIIELRQAIALLDRRATPQQRECAELLASGLLPIEVAEQMKISASRVSQLKDEMRKIMAPAVIVK